MFALGVIPYRMLAGELPSGAGGAGAETRAPRLEVPAAPALGDLVGRMLQPAISDSVDTPFHPRSQPTSAARQRRTARDFTGESHMPLVRISLREGKPEAYCAAIGDAVHRAMVETINVPPKDRFQIVTQHGSGGLVYDSSYLDIARTEGVVVIQITLNAGRSIEMKKALYARIAELLAASPGVRREDVFVSLVEVPKENWSFGNGVAQYA